VSAATHVAVIPCASRVRACEQAGVADGAHVAPPRSLCIANRLIPLRRPAIEASNLLDCDGKNVPPYYTTHALHAPHGSGVIRRICYDEDRSRKIYI